MSLSTESLHSKPASTPKLQSFSPAVQHILSYRQFSKFQSLGSEETALTPSKNAYQHKMELLT